MASIIKLGSGKQPPRAIDFYDDTHNGHGSGTRKRVRLGTVTYDEAQEAKLRIEKLLAAKHLHQTPDPETQRWLAKISDTIHDRLARAALCEPRKPATIAPTLGDFIDKYLQQRKGDLATSSHKRLSDTAEELKAYFGAKTLLDKITPDNAFDWRAALSREKRATVKGGDSLKGTAVSEATIRLHCRNAKTIFNAAVDRELIHRNPFKKLKSTAIAAERERYVSPAETVTILASCPNVQWRTLIGLCRYAGLRCPSESHTVGWQDVDWERHRLAVYASKTDEKRFVPIVPELMPMLEEAFEQAPEGATQIITLPKNNRHRRLQKILERAGIANWEDLFQTLRRSCETWLSERFPQHAVSYWIGHSMQVSEQHYLQVTGELMNRAAGIDGSGPTSESAAKSAAVGRRTSPEFHRTNENPENGDREGVEANLASCNALRLDATGSEVRLLGLEPRAYGLKVPAFPPDPPSPNTDDTTAYQIDPPLPVGSAQRKAQRFEAPCEPCEPLRTPAIDDPGLNFIVQNWANFSPAKKAGMEALARADWSANR